MRLRPNHSHAADGSQATAAGDPADNLDGGLTIDQATAPAAAEAPAPKPDAAAFPLSAVVRITDQIGGATWQGAGVPIAPDEILTASHVVHQTDLGTATNISVAPGSDGGAEPFRHVAGPVTHFTPIESTNDRISKADAQKDYAMIHLAAPMSGPGVMGMTANFAGGSVHVTGYPSSAKGAMVDSTQAVTVNPDYTLLNGSWIGGGSSGRPVWTYVADGTPSVVGRVSTHTGSVGNFTQITAPVLNQIRAWVQQDHAPAASLGRDLRHERRRSGRRQAYAILRRAGA